MKCIHSHPKLRLLKGKAKNKAQLTCGVERPPLLLADIGDGDWERGLQLQSRKALADFGYEKPEKKIKMGVELL